MNWNSITKTLIPGLLLVIVSSAVVAQDAAPSLIVAPGYYMKNNSLVWLTVNTKSKVNKKFVPIPGITVNLYLDSSSAGNFIGKVTTDEKGLAKAGLPVSLQKQWESGAQHKFIAVSVSKKPYDETSGELDVTKAKIVLDTLNEDDKRSVTAKVLALDGTEWKPVKDVEMKVGINRLGSILLVGDEATYTTDSTGVVTAEFKKEKLPGDEKGNITLVAKVEDNDTYGNIVVERSVPWGIATKYDNHFLEQRTLYSSRFHAPGWLMFMAYSIIAAVWGVIIFLVFQALKIKRLGLIAKSST
jgi:hypothetical protein